MFYLYSYYRFTAKSVDKKTMKIGRDLAKLRATEQYSFFRLVVADRSAFRATLCTAVIHLRIQVGKGTETQQSRTRSEDEDRWLCCHKAPHHTDTDDTRLPQQPNHQSINQSIYLSIDRSIYQFYLFIYILINPLIDQLRRSIELDNFAI